MFKCSALHGQKIGDDKINVVTKDISVNNWPEYKRVDYRAVVKGRKHSFAEVPRYLSEKNVAPDQ